ncbi:hypothetical protein H920_09767 [Fukomys damarensis]|uniref:Uncharacterized protein n=1 Tax=Fukomys damarensis TaxID=885580 RepID=A0A091DEY4_FUKDA|nr:hypothetical protein H920_09767 [Fukomys damarensis]
MVPSSSIRPSPSQILSTWVTGLLTQGRVASWTQGSRLIPQAPGPAAAVREPGSEKLCTPRAAPGPLQPIPFTPPRSHDRSRPLWTARSQL